MRKAIQRRVLSVLSTRLGILFVIGCVVLTLNSSVHLIESILALFPYGCGSNCKSNFVDNISGRSFERELCNSGIDVVYTWVNGSDPRQIRALADFYRKTNPKMLAPKACTTTGNVTKCDEDEPEGANRFRDNNELLFSLRSLEKYAPWVRRVYIVTNGQIPAWLNLDNPRVRVVTHDEIFANKTHLPSFSSPAIETHLQDIPGLSKRFVYCNDDTFFGNEVWPDDFYTHGSGQKVYLSWPVPNCADGCPSSWIGDGYCDRACNTSACDWDGGDCLGANATERYSRWSSSSSSTSDYSSWWRNRGAQYCAPGCPDAWIGDRYCDRACKTASCGWDGGDCGFELIFHDLPGLNITAETTDAALPPGIQAGYLNLSALLPADAKLLQGSHDSPAAIRAARISQKEKAMVLVLQRNVSATVVHMGVEAELASGVKVEYNFNLTVDSSVSEADSSGSSSTSSSTSTGSTVGSASATSGPGWSAGTTTAASGSTGGVSAAAAHAGHGPGAHTGARAGTSGAGGSAAGKSSGGDAATGSGAAGGAASTGGPTASAASRFRGRTSGTTAAAGSTGAAAAAAAAAPSVATGPRTTDADAARTGSEVVATAPAAAAVPSAGSATAPTAASPPHGAHSDSDHHTPDSAPLAAHSPLAGSGTHDTATEQLHAILDRAAAAAVAADVEERAPAGAADVAAATGDAPATAATEQTAAPDTDRDDGVCLPGSSSSSSSSSGGGGSGCASHPAAPSADSGAGAAEREHHEPGATHVEAHAESPHAPPPAASEPVPAGQAGAAGTIDHEARDAELRAEEAARVADGTLSPLDVAPEPYRHELPEIVPAPAADAVVPVAAESPSDRTAATGRAVEDAPLRRLLAVASDTPATSSWATQRAGASLVELGLVPGGGALAAEAGLAAGGPAARVAVPVVADEQPYFATLGACSEADVEAARVAVMEGRSTDHVVEDLRLYDFIHTAKAKQLELAQYEEERRFNTSGCVHGLDEADITALGLLPPPDPQLRPLQHWALAPGETDEAPPLPYYPWEDPDFELPSAREGDDDAGAGLMPMPSERELRVALRAAEEAQGRHDPRAHPIRHAPAPPVRSGLGRRLLADTYGDSLRFVNNLMNKAFGASSRKVPAHMCHFLDRDILDEIRNRWPAEWEATSSHQVRNSKDMQFAFTYFYYLMHEREPLDLKEYWRTHLDIDGDGRLNDIELRLLARTLVKDVTPNYLYQLQARLLPYGGPTLQGLLSDTGLVAELQKVAPRPLKYRHQVVSLDEVSFFMVKDNDTRVRKDLDSIRHEQKKFICLNDDMNKTHPNPKVIEAIHDFYLSFFPHRSQFELPPGQTNEFLHMDEYLAAKQARQARRRLVWLSLGGAALTALLLLRHRAGLRRVFRVCCGRGRERGHLQILHI